MVGTTLVSAEDVATFDLNTGQLQLPKVEVLSSTGNVVGTYQSELQQVRDDPSRDFVVVKNVLAGEASSNRHLARLFLRDVLSDGELDVVDEIFAPEAVLHMLDSFTPDFGTGPKAMKQIAGLYRSTFPNLDITIGEVIATGDKVIVHFTINGTQQGDLPGIPATGIKMKMGSMDIFRINNGQIVELWHHADTLGLMKQLGAMPEAPTADSTVLAQNKNLVTLFLRDILSEGKLEVADDIFSSDAVIHRLDSFTPDFGTGPEAMKQIAGLYHSTFPDLDIVIDDVFATGEKVIARFTINGIQQGDLPGIPATGLAVSMTGIDIYRINDGKIVEFWHGADTLGLMKQVGAMPDMQ